jgi:hypothetical protein
MFTHLCIVESGAHNGGLRCFDREIIRSAGNQTGKQRYGEVAVYLHRFWLLVGKQPAVPVKFNLRHTRYGYVFRFYDGAAVPRKKME